MSEGRDMKKLIWKFRFCFWWIVSGYPIKNILFFSEQAFHENHPKKIKEGYRIFTPKQAAREIYSWSRK
jgi:hypothetical protein